MLPLRPTALSVACCLMVLAVLPLEAQRRKKDEDFTQTLEVFPDPPLTVIVETARLSYFTAPMTEKGLLSQQVRDTLRTLFSRTRRAQIVKLRAFVAGTGDMRRVQAIVSEVFTQRKQPLPVLSVVQVGALPLDGAQLQMEATVLERKPVNPAGLAFLSGQYIEREGPIQTRVLSLAEQSLANLRKAATAAGAAPAEMLRVSCFLSSIEDVEQVRAAASKAFPRAQMLFAQPQRSPRANLVECEGVARLKTKPSQDVVFLNPGDLPSSKSYAQAALVGSPRLVLAGAQLAFRYSEDDARLAFQRLERSLQAAGASLKHTVMMNTYPLSTQLADLVRKVRFDFLDPARPPASTLLCFEGLPSMDAAFALEAVTLPGPANSSPNP